MDPIERLLTELSARCAQAWVGKGSECAACPVGEVAAMVAAALTFYHESKRAEEGASRLQTHEVRGGSVDATGVHGGTVVPKGTK